MGKDLPNKKLHRTAGNYPNPIRWQKSYSSMGTDLLSSIRFQQKKVFAGSGDLGTGRIFFTVQFSVHINQSTAQENCKEGGGAKLTPTLL